MNTGYMAFAMNSHQLAPTHFFLTDFLVANENARPGLNGLGEIWDVEGQTTQFAVSGCSVPS
jgi:hypothetical protein